MLDINLLHTQLNIDAVSWTTHFHETIQRVIEEQINAEQHTGDWRVTKIKEESSTSYATGLATDLMTNPKSILTEALATFEIELEQHPFPTRMTITAKLISNGKLMITQVQR